MRGRIVGLLLLGLTWVSPAQAVDLEAYGRLPQIEDVEISPDGAMVAYILQGRDEQQVVVQRIDGEILRRVSFEVSKIRDVSWADVHFVLISRTITSVGHPIRFEYPQIASLNVATGHIEQLLNLDFGIAGTGEQNGRPVAYMFGGDGLLRVDLETGDYREHFDDREYYVTDYLLDESGAVIAREQYEERRQTWTLSVRRDDGWHTVQEVREPIDHPSLVGLTSDERALLVYYWDDDQQTWLLRPVTRATGEIGAPLSATDNAGVVVDAHRRMVALVQTTVFTTYDFIEPARDEVWARLAGSFPGSQVTLSSFTPDFGRLIIFVQGSGYPGTYYLHDVSAGTLTAIGRAYPDIGAEDIAEVRLVRYAAADGMEIPAFLTLPPGRPAENLPLVVLPHGGPQARDTVGFDWMAQALASRGYAVLQPNFRGSTGYGYAHLSAGYGQWGRKMQTDLSDGVGYLAQRGIVDASRVCIMGASYGGYAALAGVTLQQGVYRCAVSIAGVSDVENMLDEDVRLWGSRTRLVRSQLRYLGIERARDPSLREISPLRAAENGDAPVLLIHGRDDSVVPYSHSTSMERALRRAGRSVELVQLRAEDHWLSREATRVQALTAAVAFIEQHNPPN